MNNNEKYEKIVDGLVSESKGHYIMLLESLFDLEEKNEINNFKSYLENEDKEGYIREVVKSSLFTLIKTYYSDIIDK